jgi:hypothetical protein
VNSRTRISTFLVFEIVLSQICIKICTLDDIVMILSSCLIVNFQCISIYLQLDQESFGTQALLGPSCLVNKCFGTQMPG